MSVTSARTVKVLIAGTDPNVLGLYPVLEQEGIEAFLAGSPAEALRFLESAPHCIAVLDVQLTDMGAFEIFKMLHGERKVPTLMVVPPELHRQFLLDSQSGPNDECIAKPVERGELLLRLKALMFRLGYQAPVGAGAGAGLDRGERQPVGRIVMVFHAKGGVGASTVATNLAVGLARHELRTLLVDADLWFGDLGVLMNAQSSKSLFDHWHGQELDELHLQSAIVPHESGVSMLLRPDDPFVVEGLDSKVLAVAVRICRTFFDYVVVDTYPSLDELTLQLLDLSDEVLLVATPELTASHNTARFLRIAEAIGYQDKVTLVLNRANSGVRTDMLEQHLQMSVAVALPSSGRLAVDSANRGVPVLIADAAQKDPFTRALDQLVELVANRGATRRAPQPEPQADTARRKAGLGFWRLR